jgi:uncharacterized lipoprotein
MNKTLSILILTMAIALLAGCSHNSAVEQNFGNAYREAVARTTDDPEGSAANAERPAPSGLDGKTASQVIGRHRQALQPGSAPTLPLPMIVTDGDSLGGM